MAKKSISKGASKKSTKPKLVIPPVDGENETPNTQRSISIGSPVDEETLKELKEKARKL
jgi:hypothetical protein